MVALAADKRNSIGLVGSDCLIDHDRATPTALRGASMGVDSWFLIWQFTPKYGRRRRDDDGGADGTRKRAVVQTPPSAYLGGHRSNS